MPTFVISGKKENASQKQSTQKTPGCGRLVSRGQRIVRGVKNETKGGSGCVHRTYMYIYCSYTLKRLFSSVIRK